MKHAVLPIVLVILFSANRVSLSQPLLGQSPNGQESGTRVQDDRSDSSADGDLAAQREAGSLFLSKISPLLVQKCGACHGQAAKKIKGGFDIRSRASLLKGGESGELAIDLKNPESSLLLTAVRWSEGLEMPPKANDRLSSEQIGWIREWIKRGAPWPTGTEAKKITEDKVWSEPGSKGKIRIRTSGGQSEAWTDRRYSPDDLWAYRPIAKVEVPWLRVGDDQRKNPIDAFIEQKLSEAKIAAAPEADKRTLFRRTAYDLTGLPQGSTSSESYSAFVSRLLDSPHYGERMAQHWLDVVRYADSNGYARDDFRNKAHRYRTYVIESFNVDKPFDQFIREQIASDELGNANQDALSFLWMGPWEHTAMSVGAVTRQLWLDDVTHSIGVTFLGQQLRCAKCHDHKFDPIPTRDYYSFQAIFAATKHNVKGGNFRVQHQAMQNVSILQGGALESPTEPVKPSALSLLASTANHFFQNDDPKTNRAELARWISSPTNPLTPRVIVNRVWQMHFGRGLVATPNDFGKMGADPTHPELLDWLAGWFIENDWSIKRLHRLILFSDTYRRAPLHPDQKAVALKDPINQLLSYFPSRRLTAEEIRDGMLAITGELNREIGGESVYPEINWEVAFQPRLLMGKIAPPYQPSSKRSDRNRRSIYAVRIRNLGHPFMEVMNRPGSELSCDRRDETTVAPQAFTMFHGEFMHERALALADRIARNTDNISEQVENAFELVFDRKPSVNDRTVAIDHVKQLRAMHQQHKIVKQELPKSIELQEVAERTGETKTKEFQLQKLANYEEDLKPWQVNEETRALADLCLVLMNSSEFLYVY